VGLVNDSLFTHNNSPGGAALLLPGPRGPGASREEPQFIGMQPHSIVAIAKTREPVLLSRK